MKDLQVFNNEQFGQVRMVEVDGKIYFVASDVAKALGYVRPNDAFVQHCRYTVKHRIPHPQSKSASIEVTVIPESDVYRLIARSQLESAQDFEKWIFDEVLPSIRQTGMYFTPQAAEQILNDPSFLIKALTELQKTREELTKVNKEMDEARPKVQLANAVLVSDDCILVREMAKILNQYGVDIGEKRLYEWFRENGYLIKKQGQDYNRPTQSAMDKGIFRVFESTYTKQDGTTGIKFTTKITTKGQKYFVNKFRKIKEMYEALDMFRGEE